MIPAIFFYGLGGFQTAGYIGPLSLVTRKIACVAYVIPAIFFYELGGFQTAAGYIGPLKIYAAYVQGTKSK